MMPSEKVFYPGGGGMNSDPLLFYYMCFNLLLSSVTVFRSMHTEKKSLWLIDWFFSLQMYIYARKTPQGMNNWENYQFENWNKMWKTQQMSMVY